MQVVFTETFKKQLEKLDEKAKINFVKNIQLFFRDEYTKKLNNHALAREYTYHRSINITNDIRAVYAKEKDVCYFIAIGTHKELYK